MTSKALSNQRAAPKRADQRRGVVNPGFLDVAKRLGYVFDANDETWTDPKNRIAYDLDGIKLAEYAADGGLVYRMEEPTKDRDEDAAATAKAMALPMNEAQRVLSRLVTWAGTADRDRLELTSIIVAARDELNRGGR